MQQFHCPTKDEDVTAYFNGINLSSLEDLKAVHGNGRLNCSGSSEKCTPENCPFFRK